MMDSPTAQPLLGLHVEPTIAMHKGKAWVERCRGCGCLLAITSATTLKRPGRLGACLNCGRTDWHRVELPVGPFSAAWAPLLVEVVRRVAESDHPLAVEAASALERAQVATREHALWIGSKHWRDEPLFEGVEP